MKKNNRFLTVGISVVAASALVLAGTSSSNAAVKKLTTIRIAAVVKGLDNPYFISVKAGIVDTAKALGVTANVQAAPGLNDDIGQANKLDALAGQNYDCYIVIPISSNNLSQGLGKVTKKGKPIINIDSPQERLDAFTNSVRYFRNSASFALNSWLRSVVCFTGFGLPFDFLEGGSLPPVL